MKFGTENRELNSVDGISDFSSCGYLWDTFHRKLGLREGDCFRVGSPKSGWMTPATVFMPVPSWSPTLQNSSIPHCLSELITRFLGYDNQQWTKDFFLHVCIIADLAMGSV
jgi:hypothetical protein